MLIAGAKHFWYLVVQVGPETIHRLRRWDFVQTSQYQIYGIPSLCIIDENLARTETNRLGPALFPLCNFKID